MLLLIFIGLSTSLHAEVPTKNNVTKLYVATFNRAPDAGGLDYWVNAGLNLEGIAQSFFDQPETKAVYPADSTNTDFVEAVYLNLFNRASEAAGLAYWVAELDSGRIAKSTFILAVINGAQDTQEFGNDATILTNKTTVGLAFSDAGLNNGDDARIIMADVTDDSETVAAALTQINLLLDAQYTYDLRTYIDTVNLALNFEGTINGESAQATFYSEYIGNVDFRGIPLNVHETILVINGVVETSYGGSYLGNTYALEGSARDCYLPEGITPTPIPTNATIGYVSDVVPLQCTDGATAEMSFKLQDGGGDNALVVATSKLYLDGQVVTSQSFSILSPYMTLLAYELNINNIIFLKAVSISQN